MWRSIEDKLINSFRHSKHTISIDLFGRMLDSENKRLVIRRGWLHKKGVEDAYDLLMAEFAEIVSKNEISKLIKDQVLQINLYNKISNLLPSLYWCLYIKPEEKHLTYFKDCYGVECNGEKELQMILDDIHRLTAKYKELFGEDKKEQENNEKFSFSKLVVGIEMVLDISLNRGIKLYELEHYYHLAVERSKKNKNG
jgi:hypothetical protein